jgi:hypothetical protein
MIRHLAGDLGPCQSLADDLSNSKVKPVTVSHVLAIVKAERLFVNVAEQVKRFHADVSSVQATLLP